MREREKKKGKWDGMGKRESYSLEKRAASEEKVIYLLIILSVIHPWCLTQSSFLYHIIMLYLHQKIFLSFSVYHFNAEEKNTHKFLSSANCSTKVYCRNMYKVEVHWERTGKAEPTCKNTHSVLGWLLTIVPKICSLSLFAFFFHLVFSGYQSIKVL